MPTHLPPDHPGATDESGQPASGPRHRGVFIAAFAALFAAMVGLAIMVVRYVFAA